MNALLRGAPIATATAALAAVMLAGCGGSAPRATVATCTREIVAHPDESSAGPGCKGLTQDQLWQATILAMQQGARG